MKYDNAARVREILDRLDVIESDLAFLGTAWKVRYQLMSVSVDLDEEQRTRFVDVDFSNRDTIFTQIRSQLAHEEAALLFELETL